MSSKQSHSSDNPQSRQAGWSVMQRADDPDIDRARFQLKEDIANGATGIALVFEGANSAYEFGLPANVDTIPTLFDGISLDGLHIRLDNHPHGRAIADGFIDYLQHRRINPTRTKLTFSTDPTAVLATTGKLKMSIEALKASLPQSMSVFFSSGIPGVVLEADGRPYHNAGATAAQEIGAMLSVALAHLKMVEEARHHIIYALPHIGFATALDQDPVMGVAKMRAIRLLWRRLQGERGVSSPFPAIIHVETSMRMMTKRDALNNISRSSIAAYAAILGGASSLSVLPHSFVFGLPDANARRIARNSQLIFINELNLPLTKHASRHDSDADALAEAAWVEFTRLEDEGGIMQSLIDGNLAKRIEEARDLKLASYHKNERAIVGTSQYPQNEDVPFGIVDCPSVHFTPEGISHCHPLTRGRWDEDLLEVQKIAPIEITKE
ncbi:methylmalonyl-CoA mutase family protein [uncultured Bartonella sp.]|uniref:methylmalonyl-CoA mutase family protein n=1 Tax=uncultured Bartonella sp. TaxID=104108 RepID=UPI002623DC23|nr:methylmalonyl-CoA mutase family protein [uncultured Bartonella sp.]